MTNLLKPELFSKRDIVTPAVYDSVDRLVISIENDLGITPPITIEVGELDDVTKDKMNVAEVNGYKKSYETEVFEGTKYFEQQFHELNTEEVGDMVHFIIWDGEDVASYISLYQNYGPKMHFPEHQDYKDDMSELDVIVIRKIVRDPSKEDYLAQLGHPHVIGIMQIVLDVLKQSDNGYLLETRMQHDSDRLYRTGMSRVFKDSHTLLNYSDEEGGIVRLSNGKDFTVKRFLAHMYKDDQDKAQKLIDSTQKWFFAQAKGIQQDV